MKRFLKLLSVVMVIGGALWLYDPLNRFEIEENWVRLTNPMWPNGFSTIVKLPATASLGDVLQKYSEENHDKTFTVLETKRLWLVSGRTPTWAARVHNDAQIETHLIHFDADQGYWLVR